MLPTVPGNPRPGLKGEGGMGSSRHDLELAGSLPRAGIAPAPQAGENLACRPWGPPLVAAGGFVWRWGHCPGATCWAQSARAVGAGTLQGNGLLQHERFYCPGLGCIPTQRGCDTCARRLALIHGSGYYGKHGEASAKVRSRDTASSSLPARGHAKRCQLVP